MKSMAFVNALSHYARGKRDAIENVEKYESLCANGAAEHFNTTAPFDFGKHEKLFKNINALYLPTLCHRFL